jgi:hypothetical protein
MATEKSSTETAGIPLRRVLVENLPFLIVTCALFLGSYLCHEFGNSIGPSIFPLWALLLTLGFVAAIGTSVGWFIAAGRTAVVPRSSPPKARSEDAGRPPPEIRREPPTEPWFEGPPLPDPPQRAVPRVERVVAPVENSGDALKELEDIERESARRKSRDANPSS